jgi:hypothetical protein
MGSYNLTPEEKNKILAVVITYQNVLKKFSITTDLMEYNETREFLKNIISLKSNLNDTGNTRKITDDFENKKGEEDFPF